MFQLHCRLLACGFTLVLFGCSTTNPNATAPAVAPKTMPTQEEMMANWKKASTPGAEHAQLAKLVGNWKTVASMWMDPSAKPEVTSGKATNRMILGGRFLEQTYKGKVMGMPFEGVGLTGYDNSKGEYTSTWADTMATMIMVSTGARVDGGKDLEFRSEFTCPMDNSTHKIREVTKFLDSKHYVFEMYDHTPDGREFKSMEIKYSR